MGSFFSLVAKETLFEKELLISGKMSPPSLTAGSCG